MNAAPAMTRAEIRERLQLLREDVVALGDRWDLTGKFLFIIDAMLGDCDDSRISTETLVEITKASLSFQGAIREYDSVGGRIE